MKQPTWSLFVFLFCICTTSAFAQTPGGIGAMLKLDTAKDGTTMPRIQALVPNGPAAAQNLTEGSYIIKVNDQLCKNKSLEDVVNIIRGDVGTAVQLSLADNAEGKKAKDFKVIRAAIQIETPAADPLEQFNSECQQEYTRLKKKGHTIVKNTVSDCGSYYFSFDADNNPYHIRVFVLMAAGAANSVGANSYDNSTDTNPVPLKSSELRKQGSNNIYTLEGTLSMQPNSVGVIKTFTSGNPGAGNCKGMYILIYK